MHNEIVSIGPVTIYGYGLMIAIGIVVALFIAEYRANKRGLKGDLLYPLTFLCVVFGFFSAKLLFCIVEWDTFIQNPKSIFSGSGFVVYGGIIGGVLIAYLFCRLKRLVFLDYFDIMLPSVAIAQGFGRIGCFLAGCCYGRETDSFVGIAFTNSQYAPNHVKLIPTQLFSSAGMFLIAAILIVYSNRCKSVQRGQVGALYLVLYSIGRFIIEFFRNDYRGEVGIFSTSQFISLFIFVIGVILFFLFKRQRPKAEDAAAEPTPEA